jgi:hypothetical protein
MEIDGWFLGSEINPERRFAEYPQTTRPRRNGTLACAFDPELVPEASPTVGPGRGGKAAGPRRLPRGDAVGHAGRRARQEGPDPAADSSPNTPRYLAFKAATFKPRNSSIARTTAGSIDAVPFSGCLPQLHGLCLAGKASADAGLWPGMRRARSAKICPFPHEQSEQLMSTGRCPDLPPFRLPLFLDRDHFRRGPKLGCPVPQVDYHALISERKNRQLARLFCLGWSRKRCEFIRHVTTFTS